MLDRKKEKKRIDMIIIAIIIALLFCWMMISYYLKVKL